MSVLFLIQGHLELCSRRTHQAAKRDHAILAQFGENCYEVDQTNVTWSHAESICQHNGGHLAHIANQKEQAFIYNFLVKHHGHTAWIGLNDRNYEEKFEWSSGKTIHHSFSITYLRLSLINVFHTICNPYSTGF
jgi:hypothetical protein